MSLDFISLLSRLNREGVNFVIIGGFAGVVHGCQHVDQGMDICCEFTPENLLLIQTALDDIHPVHRMTPKKKKLSLTKQECGTFKNLYLDTDIGQLDCLGFVKGVGGFEKVVQASMEIEVGKEKFNVLCIEALITAKKAMNRPHDREAILQLEALKKINGT